LQNYHILSILSLWETIEGGGYVKASGGIELWGGGEEGIDSFE
jgi:hypothetical protein